MELPTNNKEIYMSDTYSSSKMAAAFVKAQKEFGPALKNSSNPFHKSKYADLSACIEAVIDALHNNGISLTQRTHHSEHGVAVETILMHESGEGFSGGVLEVPAIKKDPQAYGSALTYARRYSLMCTVGIAPEDDDGNKASKPNNTFNSVDEYLKEMELCDSMEKLKSVYSKGIHAFAHNKDLLNKLGTAKDAAKERLMKCN